MIFHYTGRKRNPGRLGYYSKLTPLFYPSAKNPIKELGMNVDPSVYSDVIAAFSRKLFEKGYLDNTYIRKQLESNKSILKSEGFDFLGEIRSYKDFVEKSRPSKYDFNKDTSQKLKKYYANFETQNEQVNFFFIAGCQNLEMLDLRLEKAAIILAGLFNLQKIKLDNTYLILSGWNNAGQQGFKKVSFTNESIIMKNLVVLKLKHYLGKIYAPNPPLYTSSDFQSFLLERIITESKSKNTSENIRGLNSEIQRKVFFKASDKACLRHSGINLFIISSTFHLSQLWADCKQNLLRTSQKQAYITENSDRDVKVEVQNVFLIGSENSSHTFKSTDGHIVKFTIQKSLQENFDISRSIPNN